MAWLTELLGKVPKLEAVLEGVLATLVLRGVMSLLPYFVYWVLDTFGIVRSGARVQILMQRTQFFFLLLFVVLVSALSQTVIHTLRRLAVHPSEALTLLSKLPESSHFYISYILMSASILPINMLRLFPVTLYLFFKPLMGGSDKDIRDNWAEPEHPANYGIGARMA